MSATKQLVLCLVLGITIAVLGFAAQHANSAPASDPRLWVAECTDQKGQINVYRGSSSSFHFSYDSGQVRITTNTHRIWYPAHACTITSPR